MNLGAGDLCVKVELSRLLALVCSIATSG